MTEKRFRLQGDHIELIKLLKLLSIAASGAHAKYLVEQGEILLNGIREYRKRAKVRSGDTVDYRDIRIIVEQRVRT